MGTRTSTMARAQPDHVVTLITEFLPGVPTQIVPITVGADRWPGDLTDIGGKVAFSKEIDHALICARIDLAVHCLKDIPGDVPLAEGTAFGAYLPRDDVRDVVVTRDGVPPADLPAASRIGTSSVRRRAQLSIHRPDLRIERICGNVDTRLDKLDEGGRYAALILARTSLSRLGLLDRHHEVLPFLRRYWDPGRRSSRPCRFLEQVSRKRFNRNTSWTACSWWSFAMATVSVETHSDECSCNVSYMPDEIIYC
ncbi:MULTISPECIES: hydroxymethylbilane synthase [Streptosporangium]|uniref:hydroxymethylbilane synthase n=1 Tax=Streptosporangium TaxID=2000 RepID=UPI0027D8FE0F|nr:hydroxymethylbilane synthase [Streptosporangium brasiliense]